MYYLSSTTTLDTDRSALISKAYGDHYSAVFNYLRQRTGSAASAEDLAQDVFVRLLEYSGELRECTIKYFVFTVARSVLYDHLRHVYRRRNVLANVVATESAAQNNELENRIVANDLAEMERLEIGRLSPQRKIVYALYRFSERDASDIARDLSLSKRTVENHIFTARSTIRKAMERHCS